MPGGGVLGRAGDPLEERRLKGPFFAGLFYLWFVICGNRSLLIGKGRIMNE